MFMISPRGVRVQVADHRADLLTTLGYTPVPETEPDTDTTAPEPPRRGRPRKTTTETDA